jgi:GNAT superfamily N-acetyltransferase
VSTTCIALPGQDTLVDFWRTLARLSPGAGIVDAPTVVAAVFPSWAPLNNAIMLDTADSAVGYAVSNLTSLYRDAGVDGWALWIPSPAAEFNASDDVGDVPGLIRDTTTLVMQAALPDTLRWHDRVVRTSIAAASLDGDEPTRADDLPDPDGLPGLDAWVMVHDEVAVAGAWSYLRGTDCGIYAVETYPHWRRRGLARALTEHALADARHRGARTATLQSTPMGQPLYESLGFRAVGRYQEWVPVRSVPAACMPATLDRTNGGVTLARSAQEPATAVDALGPAEEDR